MISSAAMLSELDEVDDSPRNMNFDHETMIKAFGINSSYAEIQTMKKCVDNIVYTAFNYFRHFEDLNIMSCDLMKYLTLPDPDSQKVTLCTIYTCLCNLTERLFTSKISNIMLKKDNATMGSLLHVMNRCMSVHFSEHYKGVVGLQGCELTNKLFENTISSMKYPAELQCHTDASDEDNRITKTLRAYVLKVYNDARALFSKSFRRSIEKSVDNCNSDTVQVDSVCFYSL
jgi:hypothetical protein